MTADRADFYKWDPQLTKREVLLVGMIVVHWGSLEHEVFTQTLLSFDEPDGLAPVLPKAMNNLQFTEVLILWKARVIAKAKGMRAKVLRSQYEEIHHFKQYRDALAHGLWEWSATDLGRISTVRVKKREVITNHFTAEDLEHFASRLAGINFKIRFPGGVKDLARAGAKQGLYISRSGLAMFTGVRQTEDNFAEDAKPTSSGMSRAPDA
ncbi:MAG: hypothetical protein ABIU05_13340 [Nitrospirales bacterium]